MHCTVGALNIQEALLLQHVGKRWKLHRLSPSSLLLSSIYIPGDTTQSLCTQQKGLHLEFRKGIDSLESTALPADHSP